jgi:hypothetical protein
MHVSQALATLLAGAHLLLVFCHAFEIRLAAGKDPVDQAVALYGTFSGANCRYGFFAPSVPADRRVTFTMTDAAGRSWTDTLQVPHNQEVNSHLHSVLARIHHPQLRHAVAASWAAMMFGRHPQAVEVVVRVEMSDIPTLAQHRAGQRPSWETIYEAAFSRAEEGPSREED